MQMRLPRIDLGGWRIWAMALVVAGIVHLSASLVAPQLAGQPGYERLVQSLPMHRFEVLAPVGPASQPLPFWSPDFRYAVCRFQTAQGLVSVSANLPDSGWTLSIFTKDGEAPYAVAGQAGRGTQISLQIVPPGERFLGISQDAVASQSAGVPLSVSAREGVVIVRAPLKGFSYKAAAEGELRRAQCAYRRQ